MNLGGTKRVLKAVLFQTIIAWWLAAAVYQIGSIIEKGRLNLANVIVIGIICGLIILIVSMKNKNRVCMNCPYIKQCENRK